MFNFYIGRVEIARFQGVEALSMRPVDGLNLLAGAGDVGKTSILNAIKMVLVQDQLTNLTTLDYYAKNPADGFTIITEFYPRTKQGSLPAKVTARARGGSSVNVSQNIGSTEIQPNDQAFTLTAIGTPGMELVFENEKAPWLSEEEYQAALSLLASTHIIGQENSTRNVQYIFAGSEFNSSSSSPDVIGAGDSIAPGIEDNSSNRLQPIPESKLNHTLLEYGFPYSVQVSKPVVAVNRDDENLLLTDKRTTTTLPSPAFGNSTKSLVARLAEEVSQPSSPFQMIDHFESSMDVPSQHIYFDQLSKIEGQSLIATSGAEIVRISDNCALFFIGPKGKVGRMQGNRIDQHRKIHPSTFLSQFVIIGEGATEVGFVRALMEIALETIPEFYSIIVNDGTGHEFTKVLVDQILNSGHKLGAFVDFESDYHSNEWKEIKRNAGNPDLIFQWPTGCIEENYIRMVPAKYLTDFISHPEAGAHPRLKTIAMRTGYDPKPETKLTIELVKDKVGKMNEFRNLPHDQKEVAVDEKFVQLMIEAALGKIPNQKFGKKPKEYREHSRIWFKSIDGGKELAEKLITCGVWDAGMKDMLMPFIKAIFTAVGLTPIEDLPVQYEKG